jgi:glycosyltransferase involved in cell wall biosynthesis
LFLGHLGASFNQDALDYFVRRIYPALEGTAGLSVTVVGGSLPKRLEFFAHQPNVDVVGSVGDVRPYLHRASCLVIPLRFGGGLRIRILEAMSAGIPVVCSSVAIAGMAFEPGRDFVLADTPEDAVEGIRRLLSDEAFSVALAAAAERRVRERYATDVQEERGVEIVRRLVASP